MSDIIFRNESAAYYIEDKDRYEYWAVMRANYNIPFNGIEVLHCQYLVAWVSPKAVKTPEELTKWSNKVRERFESDVGPPPFGFINI